VRCRNGLGFVERRGEEREEEGEFQELARVPIKRRRALTMRAALYDAAAI
jgi:hypothetical protein